jgi:hypothetical protein
MKLNQNKAFATASPSGYQGTGFVNRLFAWSRRHPVLAILLVSLMAVAVNCYPVIFCGRSYVSPDCVSWLVYDWWPMLPATKNEHFQHEYVSAHGSDTGAMMWWGVPMGFVESHSLLDQRELPLWDRYGHAGATLIGQAVSMLGDPLQLIIILGHGSAGAWDVKFVVAKFLFCVGFGLLILRILGSRALAVIYAALAAYCGVFFLIYNHPVFFVFCYGPWILLSALAWFGEQSPRRVCWGLVWLLANFSCFTAGHVEPAVVLIGGLNLTALACALARQRQLADWAAVIGRVAVGAMLFLGLTAPMWMSFFAALKSSYSLHSEVHVVQLPWVSLLGVFDDIFYLLRLKGEAYGAVAPGTSLLVMVGVMLSALRWRKLKDESFFWVNSGAILLWGGIVFGWVPASVIAAVPLLNRVGHVYADFSCLLAIHLMIQSACGFMSLAREDSLRRVAENLLWVAVIFGVMVLVYDFGITHRPIPWGYILCSLAGAMGAPLLFVYLRNNSRPIPLSGWAGIIILAFAPHFRFGLYSFGNAGNADSLMIPGKRAVLSAPSKAITRIKEDRSSPFRVVGMGWILAGDYSAVYGLEDIRSCAPLSNGQYINLIRNFPGVAFGGEGGWGIEIENPEAAQPLLNLLNVKYLLAQLNPKSQVRAGLDFRVTDRSDFLVLENLEAWPRAFFTDKISTNSSTEMFVNQLLANSKQPFVSLSPDEIKNQSGLQPLENTKSAVIVPATGYELLPNSTAFDIHAPSAGVVFLAEGQARDFMVKVNGETKEVLNANRAFKALYLDKSGDYHIKFTYRPRYWRLACMFFWIALGCAMVLALQPFVRARIQRKGRTTA